MITILYEVIFVLGIGITTESTSVAEAASAFLRNDTDQSVSQTFWWLMYKDYVVPWLRMCLQWYIFHVLLGRNLSIRVFIFCCLWMFLLLLALLVFPAINSVLPYRVSVFIIKFFKDKSQFHWLVFKLFKLIKILNFWILVLTTVYCGDCTYMSSMNSRILQNNKENLNQIRFENFIKTKKATNRIVHTWGVLLMCVAIVDWCLDVFVSTSSSTFSEE